MLKRPMLIILFVVITGLLMANHNIFYFVAAETLITALVMISILFLKRNKQVRLAYFNRTREKEVWIFLCFIPFICLVAFMRGRYRAKEISVMRQPYEKLSENGVDFVVLEGKVNSKEKSSDGIALVLSDCFVRDADDKEYEKAGNVIVYISQEKNEYIPVPGNKVRAYGKLKLFEKATNRGQFDTYNYRMTKGIYAYVSAKEFWITDESANAFKTGICYIRDRMKTTYNKLYPPEQAGVLTAMLLGDRSEMEDGIGDLYKNAGISHILAISGLHISLICMGIYKLLDKLRVPFWVRIILSFLYLCFFIVYTGGGVSALRAGMMTSVLLLSKVSRRHYDMLSSLAFSGIVILFINPNELTDTAFILSMTAVSGVYFAGNIKAGVFTGMVITLMTLPVVLSSYYETSVYGPVTNLLIIPMSEYLLTFGLLSGVFGTIFLPFGGLFAGLVCLMLRVTDVFSRLICELPYSYVCTGNPGLFKDILYYVGLFGLFHVIKRKYDLDEREGGKSKKIRLKMVCLLIPTLLFLIPKGNDSISFLDVGQGDSCVFLDKKECIVVDNGSSSKGRTGINILAPYLKYNGVTIIDRFIVTHTDSDHISGLLELLEKMEKYSSERDFYVNYDGNIAIECIILPKVEKKDAVYMQIEKTAAEKGVRIEFATENSSFLSEHGKYEFICLAPHEAFRSENKTSLVYVVNSDDMAVFMMGDADTDEEKTVIMNIREYEKGRILEKVISNENKIKVLKAGHHGSRTASSDELLLLIDPDVTVISCGKNNMYGHPHRETVERLYKYVPECYLYRTDELGEIIVKMKGKRVLLTMKSEKWQ